MVQCHVCERVSTRNAGQAPDWDNIYRFQHWDLVHSYNSSLLGWLVLVARRHVHSTHELGQEEAAELGSLIPVLSKGLNQLLSCEKVYQMQYSEQPGHEHIHIHFVPKSTDIPEDRKGVFVFGYLGADDSTRVSEVEMDSFAHRFRKWLASQHAI